MGLLWLTLIAGALLAGALAVAVLVAPSSLELPLAVGGVVALGAATYALSRVVGHYDVGAAALWGFAFMVGAAGGGYALASTLLHLMAKTSPPPSLPETLPAPLSKAAVLVVTCTEPEHYQPTATAQMLQSLADEGLLEASIGSLPLIFFAQKTRYRAIGGSNPAHAQVRSLAERLGESLRDVRIEPVRCTNPLALAQAATDAVLGGCAAIVLAELSVGEPVALATARNALDDLRLPERGIPVRSTGMLWCSERIVDMLARRVLSATAAPDSTGVVLVGHGQPDEVSRKNPRMDEDETSFLNRLRLAIIELGLRPENVRIAWADWGDPDVTSTVRHLAALGCTRVLVEPAAFPVDSIATRLDLELAVRQARLEEGAATITLPAWKDDPIVVEEMLTRINEVLEQGAP
jgi:protoheme ferro-lyase